MSEETVVITLDDFPKDKTPVRHLLRRNSMATQTIQTHDRKTFITLAKKYKVDEYAIKYIVGHQINDITEKTYTEREFSWLVEEIEKIK